LKGYIFNIKKFAIHDGPGIRTTIFLQGCPLSCWWCHNPESIRKFVKNNGSSDDSDQIPISCISIDNPLIKAMTVDELLLEVKKDIIFFEESGGGVTFSGGEPLVQHQFLKTALEECRKNNIHTIVDTSGYSSYSIFQSINEYVDQYLYDLKIIDDADHKKYTGVANKLIIDNMKKLLRDGKKLNLRIPLIPGISDTDKNLSQLSKLVEPYINSISIDFLPYNEFSESKYSRFNQKPKLGKLETQSADVLNKIKTDFEEKGFKVNLRG
jgi:pyruvate formate lyase activating enzyme